MLYFIEQGLMPKTGKRYEWEIGRSDRPSACADVPGLRLGRRGAARAHRPRSGTSQPCRRTSRRCEYGDQCWSKVLVDWDAWRRDGLTEHANWWPGAYRAFCARRGETPDPAVEAFAVSYKDSRADLKAVAE